MSSDDENENENGNGMKLFNIILYINYDTSLIESILDNENESLDKYKGYNVVYMIVIGIYKNGFLIKFGVTSDLEDRLKQHKKTYIPQTSEEVCESTLKLIYVAKTDNNYDIEDTFKQLVKSKGLNVELEFQGSTKVELFVTNNVFTVEVAKKEMTNIVKNKKTKLEQEKDEYIKKIIDNEKTKQLEIECNRDIIIKKLECEKEIRIAEENRKAEEAKAKQAKENRKVQEAKKLEENINDSNMEYDIEDDIEDNENMDIYFKFLNECTEESTTHIKTTELYDIFKKWFKLNFQNCENAKIPSNRKFIINIKKYKTIEHVKINGSSSYGIKKLQCKNKE